MSNNHFDQNVNELIINIDLINENLNLCERLNKWNIYLISAQLIQKLNNLFYDDKNFKNNRVKTLDLENHKFKKTQI